MQRGKERGRLLKVARKRDLECRCVCRSAVGSGDIWSFVLQSRFLPVPSYLHFCWSEHCWGREMATGRIVERSAGVRVDGMT